MKEALDVVMAWQLRNPNVTDTTAAIEAVKTSRGEQTDSELPLRLASHFLQLTIPPLFAQNKATSNALEASRQPAPWKEAGNQYALDLLEWTIGTLGQETMKAKWHFLMPPILGMIDDVEVQWKAKGCHMLNLLLERLQSVGHVDGSKTAVSKQGSSNFLQRTGYDNIFADALLPMFTYIPSITPEHESVSLFKEALPAVTLLALLLPTNSSQGDNREQLLDKVVRQGILSPLAHLPTPSSYPELATLITSHVPVVLGHMGIDTVKHLAELVPLLSAILQEPFALGHVRLLDSTFGAVQSVMVNGWPRLHNHRAAMMMGLCMLWRTCVEEQKKGGSQGVERVKTQVKEAVAMLDAVMQGKEDGLVDMWKQEKQHVVEAAPGFDDLFAECMAK